MAGRRYGTRKNLPRPSESGPHYGTPKVARPLGRPRLPTGTALHGMFTVRVLPDEKREFAAVAKAAGLTLSQWARERLKAVAAKEKAGSKAPRSSKPSHPGR